MINTINQSQLQLSDLTLPQYPEILTDDAMSFLLELHQRFDSQRLKLLVHREAQQALFDSGVSPDFPMETSRIRNSEWEAASIPQDLLDRRVEITGPVDRKMVINALNSGANTFMADFEDSTAPSWKNIMEGQQNLKDANLRTIELHDPIKNKSYVLNKDTAVLLVRPRGLHLNEKHLVFEDQELSGSLVDFGLYVFHNTKTLLERGTAPYFYLPKLENYEEARWWNNVFNFAQEYLGVPLGTFKCTLLVETITASFQLNEFIYELKDHIVGLNCGRWDYIFSYIKKLKNHPGFIVPNRDQVTMTTPFMDAYSRLVISVCHQRGIHAMGGMAAQIPIKNNPSANEAAIKKVKADKEREVLNGHDGTWVAHPGLVSVAKNVFDRHMPNANQIDKKLNLRMTPGQLLAVPEGTVTEEGVRKNINVAILYLESWLAGKGAAALYHLMEDAATAEISRTQLWHWLDKKVRLEDGREFTLGLYQQLLDDEVEKIILECGPDIICQGKYKEAVNLLNDLVTNKEFVEFLTLSAYKYL